MKRSSHITLGSVCYRLKDAKFFAHHWSKVIQDPMWSMATEALLIALMRKLQTERGKEWDMPDLRLLAQSSREDILQIIRICHQKSACALDCDSRSADALILNVHIALSGLSA